MIQLRRLRLAEHVACIEECMKGFVGGNKKEKDN
jgi:hypothetical protein